MGGYGGAELAAFETGADVVDGVADEGEFGVALLGGKVEIRREVGGGKGGGGEGRGIEKGWKM